MATRGGVSHIQATTAFLIVERSVSHGETMENRGRFIPQSQLLKPFTPFNKTYEINNLRYFKT